MNDELDSTNPEPKTPKLSARARGILGHAAMVAKTDPRTRRAWARKGGRKPNRTYDEIVAGIFPERRKADTAPARRVLKTTRKGERPSTTTRFE